MLNFKIFDGKSLFFSKKHAKKTPIKNKKNCRFAKKKLNQDLEQASERASKINQASEAIQESQAKLVSQPKTGNRCFCQKKAKQIKPKQNKQPNQANQSNHTKQTKHKPR